ncbi:calcium-binding protein [Nitrosomonas sp. Is37]|nr:calcium-binding protein [Nitrosomonas sp. Is37]
MEGVNPGEVTVTRDPSNLYLTLQSTGERITVSSYFYQDAASAYVLDAIEFSDGTSWDVATVKQKVLQGTAGADNLTGFASNDTIVGLAGNDTLSGSNGNDVLEGGDGTDMLYGGAGDDSLRGGAGTNDYLTGDAGNDTYLFTAGEGNTSINNYDSSTGRHDVLRFMEGINPGEVTVTGDASNLYLTLQSTGEKITVSSYFYQDAASAYVLDAIEFSDGTSWDVATVKQKVLQGTAGADNLTGFASNDTIVGLAGNDTLSGGNGNDVLEGGEGTDMLYGGAGDDSLRGGAGTNDYLTGDAGNDTYLFTAGEGNTTISNYDNGTGRYDVLRFMEGINPGDVVAMRDPSNLYLTLQSTGEKITVSSYFYQDAASAYVLDAIEFSDGASWDVATVKQKVLQGTAGADNLTGFASNDTIVGLAGNDTLSGGNGNDVLEGGEGTDMLYGGAGDDSLRGGAGANDYLTGDTGNDTYLFAVGEGNTSIYNYDTSAGRHDVLRFMEGVNPGEVTVTRDPSNLYLTLQSTGEKITVSSYFYQDAASAYVLDTIEFSDGTSWDVATVKQKVLQGTTGADNLTGFATNDTIDGLAGNDSLSGAGGNDTLMGGIGNDTLSGDNGNDVLEGGEGTDMLYGGSGDDSLRGGAGANDYLSGDAGNDTYLFAAGESNTSIYNYDTSAGRHDVLRFMEGVNPGEVTVKRDPSNLYLTLQSTGEKITISNYFYQDAAGAYVLDAIEFSDGTSWDVATVKQKVLQGTTGADSITGFATNDTIDGLAGNDSLSGAGGNDTLMGGIGNDTLSGDNGNDVLEGGEGTDMLYSGSGDDSLRGGAGANDYLSGDAGNDTYLFAAGEGNTSINNYDTSAGRHDVLRFMEGVNPGEVTVTRDPSNLYLTLQSTGEKITISNYFYQDAAGAYVLDAIEFSDGTSWDVATVKQKVLQGTAGADNITGFASNDTIDGLAGNDSLSGAGGNDTLMGGIGNDTLSGDNGNDVLEGGEGTDMLYSGSGDDSLRGGAGANDYLSGDAGNDTYLFAAGEGNTSINNYDTSAGRHDVLRFMEGVNPGEVTVTRDPSNLYLTLQSTGEKITISNYFYQDAASAYVLDTIEFSDGTSWDVATVKQKVLQGTAGADNITGFASNDTIDGLAGNDTLSGGNSNDVLEGGEGTDMLYGGSGGDSLRGGAGANDYLTGDGGNDTYLFNTADGKDTINNYDTEVASFDILRITDVSFENLWFSRSGNNLQLNIVGTDDQLTITNWYSGDIYQLNQIITGSSILLNKHVDQLVSAMSSYEVPSGAGNVISQDVMDALQSVFTEVWL